MFFFKQKTAYEMRISDWSSDVCSSDLAFGAASFKAASDAAEMESAFDVSFGNSAASVRKWAEETGNALGRSTQEMMSMSASFQEIGRASCRERVCQYV